MHSRLTSPGAFRLFLAILVVLQHAGLVALGAWAVFLFFVLSGYWVSRMWWEKYRERSHSVIRFYLSRSWRLWPTYVVCQLINLAVYARFSPRWAEEVAVVRDPVWVLRSLMIVSTGGQKNFLPPIWTLDVEMQFYLVLPLLAALMAGTVALAWRSRILLLVGVSVPLFGLLVMAVGPKLMHFLPATLVFFLLGMACYFYHWRVPSLIALISASSVATVLVVVAVHPIWRTILGYEATRTLNWDLYCRNIVFCGFLALIAAPLACWTAQQRSPGLDRHFGNISYVLYLMHAPVMLAMDWTRTSWPVPTWMLPGIEACAIAAGSMVVYWLVDLPSEHWRRRAFG